jgi:hypothetical protein
MILDPLHPLSSRGRSDGTLQVELRGMCPRLTVDVLDAVASARGLNRTDLVNELLSKWAEQQLREASLIARVTRGNPEVADAFGV